MIRVEAQYQEPPWFQTLACFCPLMMFLVIGATHSWSSLAVLGICLLTLILSASWLCYAVFLDRRVRLAFVAAVLLVCLGWGWQGSVYFLIADCSLKFGYFLTSSGRSTSLALLLVPVASVGAGLFASLIVGLWLAWRSGRRWSLIAILEWWLMATLLFLLPDIYLALQGYGVDL